MYLLKILRWPNLLITALIFAAFRYGFLYPMEVATSLSELKYFLLFLSVASIMGAGYIINDIHDKKADKINKTGKNLIGKEISETNARYLYWVLSIFGLLLGYFMGYTVGIPSLGSIHLISFFLLWMYSTDFKHRPLIGNIVISFLATLAIIVIPLFDVIPANRVIIDEYRGLFVVFSAYAIFAFWNTWIRELIKDVEDIEGDRKVGSRTIAVTYGEKTSKIIINTLIAIEILALFYIIYLFVGNVIAITYIIALLILPLLILIYFVYRAQKRKDWTRASTMSKLIIMAGILSVVVITLL